MRANCEPLGTEFGKEVVRCTECGMKQFLVIGEIKYCRRCRADFSQAEPEPEVEVSSETRAEKVVEMKPPRENSTLNVALACRLLREAQGLSQKVVALKMKAARTYITKVETRVLMPDVNTFKRLAHGLNVAPAFLITLAEVLIDVPLEVKDTRSR